MTGALARDAASTYRYLRGTIIALLLMLAVSVLMQTWDSGCWLGSISAYYYTPVRTVFVGSLFALGAALIAYRGQGKEEVLLNFSGFMAFVVAMVPTVPDAQCDPADPAAVGFQLSDAEIAAAVTNNIRSLIAVTVLAIVAVAVLKRKALVAALVGALKRKAGSDDMDRGTVPADTTVNWGTVVSALACVSVIAVELFHFLVDPDQFIARSHGIAASTMVVGVILVMLFNLKQVDRRHSDHERHSECHVTTYKVIYRVLVIALILMLAFTAWVAWTWHSLDHVILIVEFVVIVDFIAFWGVQTWELRGHSENVGPQTPGDPRASGASPRPLREPTPAGA